MKKVYLIIQRTWIRGTDTYSHPMNIRVIATLDKVRDWLLSYCDYRIRAYKWHSKDAYLQDKEHYTLVKEYFEKYLEQYTEETFDIGHGINAYDFCIECIELIE